jgi:hypothetical protein
VESGRDTAGILGRESFIRMRGHMRVCRDCREARTTMRCAGRRPRNWDFLTSWSPDGRWIAYTRKFRRNNPDVEVIPTAAPGTPVPSRGFQRERTG